MTMSKPFKGVINLDVRDSTPDWEPSEQPKAPEGVHAVPYDGDLLADAGVDADRP